MSDFTVLRSLDGYCLVLDKKRIAGSKPDYRGENVLVDWTTEVAYGPVDDLAAENAKLVMKLNAEHIVRQNVERESAKLRELVRDVVLLAGLNGCDVTKMQLHVHGGDWRTIWERMAELGVPGTEVDG